MGDTMTGRAREVGSKNIERSSSKWKKIGGLTLMLVGRKMQGMRREINVLKSEDSSDIGRSKGLYLMSGKFHTLQ